MPEQSSLVDPDGLLEYSVVFTERSLNHMSAAFQGVMREISAGLREVYQADGVAVIPGGGTFAMEAVARQFATDARCLVIRNGWFSYRWTQILETGRIATDCEVLKARRQGQATDAAFAPVPIDEAVAQIRSARPEVVFAPHVETSAGILLPDDYVQALAEATHAVGGLLVLDCVASGTLWVDMRALGVDVLISAPQKGWSASPCAGLVMLGERALHRVAETHSSSFACDLGRWLTIMRAYEDGGHAYHATLPTDALRVFRDAMHETRRFGLDLARERLITLGRAARGLLAKYGHASVAAQGFEAPGVIVCHTHDEAFSSGRAFAGLGLQIAAGVPLMCDEPADYRSFRIGLFGLDKLQHPERTLARLEHALQTLAPADATPIA
ncbi:MAG: alanine--glyoxylate aminotransferase family protein [Gammaproteobacteria bacterium]|nr:alanine--glyoxylate aminotransferase family protein [Gammaproteobacteria bacterium]